MNGVLAARTALDAAKRPRGTRANPGLSCRDLRTAHSNLTDGEYHNFLPKVYGKVILIKFLKNITLMCTTITTLYTYIL